MKAVYLTSNNPYNTQYRSDTLWGLLISTLSVLFSKSEIDEIINRYLNGHPPFVFSSAFPFSVTYNNELVHFLPRPIVCNFDYGVNNSVMMSYFKEFKKINLLSQNVFEDLVNGSFSEKDLFQKFVEFKKLQKKKELLKKELPREKELPKEEEEKLKKLSLYFLKPLIKEEQVLHNTIDRMSCSTLEAEEGGQLYTTNDYYLFQNTKSDSEVEDKQLETKQSGLYFLVDGDVDIIKPALRFLSHFGFGGNNTTGKGSFRYEIKDFKLTTPDNPNSFVSLSLFHPTQTQLAELTKSENKNKFWYELNFRAGRIGVHFADEADKNQKNIVANFVEGSTFPYLQDKYPGKLVETAKTKYHSVFNNGFCFKIPSNLKYD